ncbi:MAG: hypothetical protein LBH55_03235, partial [Mycoplasmataceae bacterium]|nr:hypothetical protein [Mycoplasmataceae bacterium]
MINDKTFGMYIEYSDIPDKDLKEEFDVSIESLLTSTLLEKDVDGWYYPNAIVRGKQENVRVFLFLVAKRLTKF